MKFLPTLILLGFLTAGVFFYRSLEKNVQADETASVELSSAELAPVSEFTRSVLRVHSTQQGWNYGQPWEKAAPAQHSSLAAIVGPRQVLTSAELIANTTYLEFETPSGNYLAQAKVLVVDYDANLALLGPMSEEEGDLVFKDTKPLDIATPPHIGSVLEILQVEENGQQLLTTGKLQTVDVSGGLLSYFVKASMQSAASSFSLPVISQGKLVGVLADYNENEQRCNVIATEIIQRFLEKSSKEPYLGFPYIGIDSALTEDPSLRQWLKLNDLEGGIYVQKVHRGSPAAQAGISQGDVILSIDDNRIDRRGYYQHSNYGSIYMEHLIRGMKNAGDSISVEILRNGEVTRKSVTLDTEKSRSKVIPDQLYGKAPNFMVKGGLIFQDLSRGLLESFGNNWQTRAPLNYLDALHNSEKYEDKAERLVVLSGVIPTAATVGYERLRHLIVHKVNGKEIRNMKSLISAFQATPSGLHSIEFMDEQFAIYVDEATCQNVETAFSKQGVSPLSRCED